MIPNHIYSIKTPSPPPLFLYPLSSHLFHSLNSLLKYVLVIEDKDHDGTYQ